MLRLGASAPSLPPNVKGASRGNIYVILEDLHWKPNVRLPFAGNSVDARLIWWGESTSTVVRYKDIFSTKKLNFEMFSETDFFF